MPFTSAPAVALARSPPTARAETAIEPVVTVSPADEKLSEEYEKCVVGLNAITKESYDAVHNTEDKREKIQALALAKECYSMKLDLLTNVTVVDDATRL